MRKLWMGCVLLLTSMQISGAQQAMPDGPKGAEKSNGHGGGREMGSRAEKPDKSEKAEKNAYSFQLPGPDGKGIPLSDYKGKTLLLVNLGHNSSYNDQLPALIALADKFKDKGLVIIGVPSNEFGSAEPGTDAEIQKLYKADSKVPFLVTERSQLTGDQALPLYEYLTKTKDAPPGGDVHWNYTKFVIDGKGKVIARFDPDVAPDSAEMLSTLDQIFDGTFKARPTGERSGGGGPAAGDSQI